MEVIGCCVQDEQLIWKGNVSVLRGGRQANRMLTLGTGDDRQGTASSHTGSSNQLQFCHLADLENEDDCMRR